MHQVQERESKQCILDLLLTQGLILKKGQWPLVFLLNEFKYKQKDLNNYQKHKQHEVTRL